MPGAAAAAAGAGGPALRQDGNKYFVVGGPHNGVAVAIDVEWGGDAVFNARAVRCLRHKGCKRSMAFRKYGGEAAVAEHLHWWLLAGLEVSTEAEHRAMPRLSPLGLRGRPGTGEEAAGSDGRH